jgi:hypothetical protein
MEWSIDLAVTLGGEHTHKENLNRRCLSEMVVGERSRWKPNRWCSGGLVGSDVVEPYDSCDRRPVCAEFCNKGGFGEVETDQGLQCQIETEQDCKRIKTTNAHVSKG